MKKNKAIGQAVTDLLDYAITTSNLRLTVTPISIADPGFGTATVTLHACWEDGRDVEIRVTVAPDGEVQELQEVRYFVSGTGQGLGLGMTKWIDLMDYEVDDFLHHTLGFSAMEES